MIKKIKIEIIKLGENKHKDVMNKLYKYCGKSKSKLFEITSIKKVSLPDSDNYSWGFTDESLKPLFPKTNADIQLGIIDYPIDDNYFGRELSEKIGIISFYQTDEIFMNANLDLMNFVLLTIYQAVTIFNCYDGISDKNGRFYHDESRGCIFDMCGIKSNIVLSATNPQVCFECEAKMRKNTLDDKYIETLKSELKVIKKPLYYRIIDWIKKHPILSLMITVISSILISITSNILYDIIK